MYDPRAVETLWVLGVLVDGPDGFRHPDDVYTEALEKIHALPTNIHKNILGFRLFNLAWKMLPEEHTWRAVPERGSSRCELCGFEISDSDAMRLKEMPLGCRGMVVL